MFRAVSFIQDPSAASAFEVLAAQTGLVRLAHNYTEPLRLHELQAALSSAAADLVFLELADFHDSIAILGGIRALGLPVATIGFGAGWSHDGESRYRAAGLTELLVSPVSPKSFSEGIQRAIRTIRNTTQDNLIAVLPAKAGSGATTVALNTAGCLTRDLGKKTLLIEADLNSGVLSYLLGLRRGQSLLDVLEHAGDLSSTVLSNAIQHAGSLHVLPATRSRPLPSWSAYHHLLEFARPRYDHILVDLPEVVNEATSEIFLRAKYVFIVCTAELPSLALAKRRCDDLEARGIPRERTGIILNRWHSTDRTEAEVEDMLGHGIAAIIPNEYAVVQRATEARTIVAPDSHIGREVLAFSKRVAGIFNPDEADLSRKHGTLDAIFAWAARRAY